MLRQIEWGVENGPLTKNGVFATNIFFKNFKEQESLINN